MFSNLTKVFTEIDSLHCHNDTTASCLQEIKINSTVSEYFDTCWIRIDPSSESPIIQSTDPNIVQSDALLILDGIMYMILSIAGVTMNLLVILAIFRSSNIRKEYFTPTIGSLATVDFLFSIYILPVLSLRGFTSDLPLLTGCEFYGFTAYCLWELSASNLLCFAVLRCIRVYFPARALTSTQNLWFEQASKIAPAICWIFAFITTIPTLTHGCGKFGFECKKFVCIIVDIDQSGNQLPSHPIYMYMGIILAKVFVATTLNIVTYFAVKRKTKQLCKDIIDTNPDACDKIKQQEKKLGIMVMTITGAFFLVYLPRIILLAVVPHAAITHIPGTVMTTFLSCCLVIIDPIVYTMTQEKYRDEIKKILSSVFNFAKSIYENLKRTESKITLQDS